ncbi:kinase-like domain-containing protein, partial [Polychytrium aggregatum]|uniref:kinase-like domain-containing protein n=1 Tax=Polychytrium aggregatum TaxID=110093 RepID=UPI0022FE4A01
MPAKYRAPFESPYPGLKHFDMDNELVIPKDVEPLRASDRYRTIVGSIKSRPGDVVFKQFLLPDNKEKPDKGDEEHLVEIGWLLDVWTKLKHRRITPLLGFSVEVCIPTVISPFYPNRDIETFMSAHPVNLETKLRWMTEIAEGLVHIHEKRCVFVDVKPNSFLLDDLESVRLNDFSNSLALEEGFDGREQIPLPEDEIEYGTFTYFAPERTTQRATPNFNTDIYAYGIA